LKKAVILDVCRTPYAKYGGALKNYHPENLAALVLKKVVDKAGVEPERVEKVVVGSALAMDTQAVFLPRHAALKAGFRIETPAIGVSCLCGTGLKAVAVGAMEIMLGRNNLVATAGSECMDMIPYYVRGIRWGIKPGNLTIEDALFGKGETIFFDNWAGIPMGLTTENINAKYGITREEQDEYALRSHKLIDAAYQSGRMAKEVFPVEIVEKKETFMFEKDEGIRKTTMEKMAKLRPVFKKDGSVTAANASGINNGAGALLLSSEEWARENGKKPLATIIDWEMVGVDPHYMGLGPIPAVRGLLKRQNMTVDQIDIFELNEAFAGQYIGCEKELGLDRNKCNVNGGAIAIGHPIAGTGVRILMTLAIELNERKKRYGICTMCIGGGQGLAMLIENTNV